MTAKAAKITITANMKYDIEKKQGFRVGIEPSLSWLHASCLQSPMFYFIQENDSLILHEAMLHVHCATVAYSVFACMQCNITEHLKNKKQTVTEFASPCPHTHRDHQMS